MKNWIPLRISFFRQVMATCYPKNSSVTKIHQKKSISHARCTSSHIILKCIFAALSLLCSHTGSCHSSPKGNTDNTSWREVAEEPIQTFSLNAAFRMNVCVPQGYIRHMWSLVVTLRFPEGEWSYSLKCWTVSLNKDVIDSLPIAQGQLDSVQSSWSGWLRPLCQKTLFSQMAVSTKRCLRSSFIHLWGKSLIQSVFQSTHQPPSGISI